jgi:hypothetical protein
MVAFIPHAGNVLLPGGGRFRIPGVAFRVNVNMFFDRSEVKSALTQMEYKGLSKASMRIKDYARKSIKKMGRARPPLKVMKQNPGVPLTAIAAMPGISSRTRKAVIDRIREIKTKPPSPPGTPPHTHVPFSHMLGFRRNLWNFYDATTHSAVVGPSRKGRMIPYLHEFGGTVQLKTWVWRPKWQRMKSPIIWKRAVGDRPKNPNRWMVADGTETVRYPERPYMYPAMLKAIARGDLAKAFGGQFAVSQRSRGVSISGR